MSSFQPRKPAGSPQGGQFDSKPHSPVDLDASKAELDLGAFGDDYDGAFEAYCQQARLTFGSLDDVQIARIAIAKVQSEPIGEISDEFAHKVVTLIGFASRQAGVKVGAYATSWRYEQSSNSEAVSRMADYYWRACEMCEALPSDRRTLMAVGQLFGDWVAERERGRIQEANLQLDKDVLVVEAPGWDGECPRCGERALDMDPTAAWCSSCGSRWSNLSASRRVFSGISRFFES